MPGERTEQATAHRRDKARKDGDILHSRELTAAAGTLAGVLALGLVRSQIVDTWRTADAGFLELGNPARWDDAALKPTLLAIRRLALSALAPVGAVLCAVLLTAL